MRRQILNCGNFCNVYLENFSYVVTYQGAERRFRELDAACMFSMTLVKTMMCRNNKEDEAVKQRLTRYMYHALDMKPRAVG